MNKSTLALIVAFMIAGGSLTFTLYNSSYKSEKIEEYKTLLQSTEDDLEKYKTISEDTKKQVSSLTETNQKQADEIKTKAATIARLQERCKFYDENVAIVVSERKDAKYHTYDCHFVRDSNEFWLYNTELAKTKGHEPCKVCH